MGTKFFTLDDPDKELSGLATQFLADLVADDRTGLTAKPARKNHPGRTEQRAHLGIRVLHLVGCCLTTPKMGNTITIRLPEEPGRWLEEEAKRTGLPKGQIVREGLKFSRIRKALQPFLDLAGSIEGEPGLSRKRGFTP